MYVCTYIHTNIRTDTYRFLFSQPARIQASNNVHFLLQETALHPHGTTHYYWEDRPVRWVEKTPALFSDGCSLACLLARREMLATLADSFGPGPGPNNTNRDRPSDNMSVAEFRCPSSKGSASGPIFGNKKKQPRERGKKNSKGMTFDPSGSSLPLPLGSTWGSTPLVMGRRR